MLHHLPSAVECANPECKKVIIVTSRQAVPVYKSGGSVICCRKCAKTIKEAK